MPRDKRADKIFRGTQIGRPPHHYRVDYSEDMTISGRKKPLDFNTLAERVEMNYQNLLFKLNVE